MFRIGTEWKRFCRQKGEKGQLVGEISFKSLTQDCEFMELHTFNIGLRDKRQL